MSNSKSIEVNVTDPGGKVIGKMSTTGQGQTPPSAGIPVTAVKNAAGKITSLNGTINGVTFDLPDSGK